MQHPNNRKMNGASPLDFLSQKDFNLGNLIQTIGKHSIETHKDPFESLVKSIIYQQLSSRSANAIYGRFLGHYDTPFQPQNKSFQHLMTLLEQK